MSWANVFILSINVDLILSRFWSDRLDNFKNMLSIHPFTSSTILGTAAKISDICVPSDGIVNANIKYIPTTNTK